MNKKLEWRKKYVFCDNFFEDIDSETKAYWFGFVLADGCVLLDCRSPGLVINLQHGDKSHLELFLEDICSNHSIRLRHNKSRNSVSVSLAIRSAKIANDLASHGCIPRKTWNPTRITGVADHLFVHFARGYFDGNGTIGFYTRKTRKKADGSPCIEPNWACFGSETILSFLKDGLSSILHIPTNNIRRRKGCYILDTTCLDNICSLFESFYSTGNPCLHRKFIKWQAGISSLKSQC